MIYLYNSSTSTIPLTTQYNSTSANERACNFSIIFFLWVITVVGLMQRLSAISLLFNPLQSNTATSISLADSKSGIFSALRAIIMAWPCPFLCSDMISLTSACWLWHTLSVFTPLIIMSPLTRTMLFLGWSRKNFVCSKYSNV